jgi:prolyl oligopeptidase
LRVDQLGAPTRRGNRTFLSRRLANQDQSVICLREGKAGEIQPLIDPNPLSADHNVSVSIFDISEDGKLLVYGLRKGGEDEIEIHLFDVDRRAELPCTLPRGLYESGALTADKTGFYYSLRNNEVGTRIYYSPLARPDGKAAETTCIFGQDYGPKQDVSCSLSEDRRYLMIHVFWGWGKRTDIFVRDLAHDGPIRPAVTGIDASFSGEIIGDTLYVKTNWKAPNGRVLSIDLKNPAPEAWREIIPERTDTVIESLTLAGGRLFLQATRNVLSRVVISRELL